MKQWQIPPVVTEQACDFTGKTWAHGMSWERGARLYRTGSMWPDHKVVELCLLGSINKLHRIRVRNYRRGMRLIRQWINGYNV